MAPHIYLQFLVPNGFHAVHAFPPASMQPLRIPFWFTPKVDDGRPVFHATELGLKRSIFIHTQNLVFQVDPLGSDKCDFLKMSIFWKNGLFQP